MNINFEKYTICLASAGCGKTYALVQNYLTKITQLSDINMRILALTFSEKAALEMQMRIKEELFLWKKDKDLKEKVLKDLPYSITTFHSFCANFIKEYGHYYNISADFNIILPYEEQIIVKDLLSEIIIQEINNNNLLIRQLIKKFKLDNTSLSIGLLEQIYNFYTSYKEQGLSIVNLKKNLNINLNKSYEDFKNASENFVLSATKTTKERAVIILNAVKELENFTNLSPIQINLILQSIDKNTKVNFAYRKNIIEQKNNYFADLYEYIIFNYEKEIISIIKKFDKLFLQHKKNHNVLSYNDLLVITKKLLCDSKIRQKFQSTISHVLIDEYQDTSSLQEDIVFLLLTKDTKNFADDERVIKNINENNVSSFFIVGDKKQSIYSFRGAKVNLLDNFTDKFAHICQPVNLSINRRSGKNILDFINLVAKYSLTEQNYQSQEDLLHHNDLTSQCNLWFSDNKDAYYTAALGIKKILQENNQSNITVLLRRIKPASIIKQYLSSLGIACKIIGGEGFFNRHEIIEILSAFKIIFNTFDNHTTLIILRSPFILLKDNDILAIHIFLSASITMQAIKDNLYNLPIENEAKQRLINFLHIIDDISDNFASKPLIFHLHQLLTNTDFLSYYAKDQSQVTANINKLSGMLINKKNPYEILYDLWQQMHNNTKEAQGLNDDNACVTIMTIHQAKGLEFDTVVLPDLESALKPNNDLFTYDEQKGFYMRPKNIVKLLVDKNYLTFNKIIKNKQQEQYQEEARLLYVAMTRAKKHLYFAYSHQSRYRNNLLNLLLRAKKHEEDYFNRLCPTIELKEEKHETSHYS